MWLSCLPLPRPGRLDMYSARWSCAFAATLSPPASSLQACAAPRLEPRLSRPVGLGPVSWPLGCHELTSYQCWPGPNQSGRIHEDAPAFSDAGAARLPPLATLADPSARHHSRGSVTGGGAPKECLFPEHKEFRGMRPHC